MLLHAPMNILAVILCVLFTVKVSADRISFSNKNFGNALSEKHSQYTKPKRSIASFSFPFHKNMGFSKSRSTTLNVQHEMAYSINTHELAGR